MPSPPRAAALQEAVDEYREVYDLARHLFVKYNGTGKVFLLVSPAEPLCLPSLLPTPTPPTHTSSLVLGGGPSHPP